MDPLEQLSWCTPAGGDFGGGCMGQNKSVPHHHCQGCPSPIPSPFSQPYAGPGIAHLAAALAALSHHIEPVCAEACRGGGSLNGRTWAGTGWCWGGIRTTSAGAEGKGCSPPCVLCQGALSSAVLKAAALE